MNKRKTKTTSKAKKRTRSEASANLKAAKAKTKVRAISTGEANKFKIEGLKPKTSDAEPTVVRSGSKLAIVAGLLTRQGGCTGKDILDATGWPTVSVPQQAKAAGLTLSKEKDGKVSRYRGTPVAQPAG